MTTSPRRSLRSSRLIRAVAAPAVLAVVLSACGSPGAGSARQDGPGVGSTPDKPAVVTASTVWQGVVDAGTFRDRLASLTEELNQLRTDTRSGWIGTQDDASGYLAELRGGTWSVAGEAAGPGEVVDAFVGDHGSSLFGVEAADLQRQPDTTQLGDSVVVRADQVVGTVPVVDGRLLFTVSDQGVLTDVRGRSFGGLDVDTAPRMSADAAIKAATAGLAGGKVLDKPVLRVIARDSGVLTWRLTVQTGDGGLPGQDAAHVYLDATTGAEVRRDPLSASAAAASVAGPATAFAPTAKIPAGEPVKVTGTDPFGKPVTANGLRTPQGVALIDTTTPWVNQGNGNGTITTYTMDGSEDDNKLPGKLVVSNNTQIADGEAVYAHSLARQVLDTLADVFGWKSWNGKGASLTTVVNLGGNDYCNAFFAWTMGLMAHGNPCTGPNGAAILVAPDVTAHEITHGITGSTAGLIYSGQSGALNEAFSDYFGNIVGNLLKDTDDATLGEDTCVNISKPQRLCDSTGADGKLAARALLNGTSYPDLLKILGVDLRQTVLGNRVGDNGGVHLNSAIWNNALWSIRTQLAQIDGKPGNESPRAKAFDQLVFATLTSQLTPTSGMVDASAALQSVITKANADPVITRVVRERLNSLKFCVECLPTSNLAGERVTRTNGSETNPAVAGNRIAWIADERYGQLMIGNAKGGKAKGASAGPVNSVAGAGDAFIAVEAVGEGLSVIRTDAKGKRTELFKYADSDSALIGVAGDASGGGWVSLKDGKLFFVNPAGKVTSAALPNLGGDQLLAIAGGGGSLAFGGKSGALYLWKPSAGPTGFGRVGQLPGAVTTVAAYGDRVYGADLNANGAVFEVGNRQPVLSIQRADPYHGATMTADYLVFAKFTDKLNNKVIEANDTSLPDVDLALHSFATNKAYSLVRNDGWQAYPHASGNRLAWVDASYGNAEILTDTLPDGL